MCIILSHFRKISTPQKIPTPTGRTLLTFQYTLHMKFLSLFLTLSLASLHAETIALFNGKDLTGWQGDGYTVEDGTLTCTPKGRNLISEETYQNYVLEFDFKLPPAGNNGIGIHYPGSGDAAYTGLEIQLLDDSSPKYEKLKPYQYHGSLYTLKSSKKGHLNPVDQWNHQKITVRGKRIKVELNGTLINEANLIDLQKIHPKHTGLRRRSGHICLCGHGSRVQFKNINLTQLEDNPSSDSPSPLKPASEVTGESSEFKKIYNETNLEGWLHSAADLDHWRPSGKILHYDGKSQARDKNLWSDKSYANFTLYCDWRWAGPASHQRLRPLLDPSTGTTKLDKNGKPIQHMVEELDSGIYLRGNNRSQVNIWNWPGGSGEVYGYRTNKKLSQKIRAALTPKVKADKAIGQWNRMVITLIGDQLSVTLNGKKVISEAQLPGVPDSGRIALQHHGSSLEFANIYIKEIK